MDTNPNLSDSFDELVFENRHKTYGAYQIRKNYNRSMVVSGLMVSIAVLFIFTIAFITQPEAHAANIPDGDPPVHGPIVVTIPQDKPKPEHKNEMLTPAKGQTPNTEPKVVQEAKPVAVNDTSAVGDPKGKVGGTGSTPVDSSSVGCKDCLPKDTTTVIPTVLDPSDPPLFADIDGFFSRNVKYPIFAKEQGIEGTVWLSWVVNHLGEVEDVQVAKSSKNKMLDAEALRVAKLMPRWTPGKDHGRPINFVYHKPIRFVLR